MKILGGMLVAFALLTSALSAAEDDRASMQQKLDAECEAARERKLEPERATLRAGMRAAEHEEHARRMPALLRRLRRADRQPGAALLRSARMRRRVRVSAELPTIETETRSHM